MVKNLLSSFITFYDKGFFLGNIEVAWYGVILTSGMVCALILMVILGKREKIEPEFCLTTFLFAIIFAIIGARLFFVVPRFNEFFTTWQGFLDIFNLRLGGLTIIGGIPCGALGVYISCRIYKKSFFRVCDIIVPCLLLGQVIGRWGNYVNGELFGFEITNPAFQKFPIAVWVSDNGHYAWHAANFFYEMMLNLVMLIIMLALTYTIKKKLKVGFMSILYIIWYGVVRGVLEFVKVGQLMWGSVRAVQLICFLCAAIGLVVLALLQIGFVKFETPKMYDRHFKIVHEPPAFGEPIVQQTEDTIQGSKFQKALKEIFDVNAFKNLFSKKSKTEKSDSASNDLSVSSDNAIDTNSTKDLNDIENNKKE